MSDTKPNNPPAFPQAASIHADGTVVTEDGYFADVEGLSMRDYFSAKAMQAILIGLAVNENSRKDLEARSVNSAGKTARAIIAECAYQQADAMLNEREKKP